LIFRLNQHAQVAPAFPQQAHWQSATGLLQQLQAAPDLHVQAALTVPQQAQRQASLGFPQQAQESEEGLTLLMAEVSQICMRHIAWLMDEPRCESRCRAESSSTDMQSLYDCSDGWRRNRIRNGVGLFLWLEKRRAGVSRE
jgi:hypothetical protein